MADMTIAVYAINRDTGQRTVIRQRRTVRPSDFPEISSQWPACTCQPCLNSPTASGESERGIQL